MMRRSIQDYEYFWLLTQKNNGDKNAADKVVNRIIKRALRGELDAKDADAWEHRPAEWHKARMELAKMILD